MKIKIFGLTVLIYKEEYDNPNARMQIKVRATKRFLERGGVTACDYTTTNERIPIIKSIIQFHLDNYGAKTGLRDTKQFCDNYFHYPSGDYTSTIKLNR